MGVTGGRYSAPTEVVAFPCLRPFSFLLQAPGCPFPGTWSSLSAFLCWLVCKEHASGLPCVSVASSGQQETASTLNLGVWEDSDKGAICQGAEEQKGAIPQAGDPGATPRAWGEERTVTSGGEGVGWRKTPGARFRGTQPTSHHPAAGVWEQSPPSAPCCPQAPTRPPISQTQPAVPADGEPRQVGGAVAVSADGSGGMRLNTRTSLNHLQHLWLQREF